MRTRPPFEIGVECAFEISFHDSTARNATLSLETSEFYFFLTAGDNGEL